MRIVPVALAACVALFGGATAADTPYREFQHRAIKALPEKEVADLLAGRGMGLALPAELNGYPGPLHVLDLADRLGLDAGQRRAVGALFADMQAAAAGLGAEIVRNERELDRLFASGGATDEAVRDVTATLGNLAGSLRHVHLRHHIAVRRLLSTEQIARYMALRGYRTPASGRHGGHDGGHRH